MFRKFILIMLGMAIVLSACSNVKPANETGNLTHIRLPMGYIPNIQFAPFYVAIQKGYFREAGIEIEFDYKFETDGVALVGSGELPFAIVSGEQVLLARSKGLPVEYVAAWYQQYPVSVVAKSDLGILIPQDLKGKKIGLPGLFGATYVGLRALLFKAHMSESDVTLDSIGFNQVDLMAAGQHADLDAKVQKQVLETSIEQWKAERLGYSDPKAWENMQDVLLEMGLITEKMDLNKAFTNEFIP